MTIGTKRLELPGGYNHTAYNRVWRCRNEGIYVYTSAGTHVGYYRRGHFYDLKGVRP